uniref:AE binding protein 2 n=1 Tax=Paramormyrops kingsleyae TaxID=1676925 RepID=A0A3B3T8I8_9TELE
MEVESTVSSGRSTPAMLTGILGGPGPAANPASSTKGPAYPCCWDRCLESFCSSPDLAEHIRGMHADSQRGGMYVCLWKGCKVYNTPSSSPSWLQRHLLSHSGDKPFKCVVAGCNASFASQGGVARHVPSHFSQQNSSKLSGQPRAKEESPSKAGVRRRRLRARHHRSLPRPHDFFDAQTMDAIRHRAICLNLATHIESLGHGHSVVFHSTVIARRKEDSGKVKVLLHWTPEDIETRVSPPDPRCYGTSDQRRWCEPWPHPLMSVTSFAVCRCHCQSAMTFTKLTLPLLADSLACCLYRPLLLRMWWCCCTVCVSLE